MAPKTKMIKFPNGLELECIYLCEYGAQTGEGAKIYTMYYCQGRVINCDKDDNPLSYRDLLDLEFKLFP